MIEYVNGIPRQDYLEIIRKTEEATNAWYKMYNDKFVKEYQETHKEVKS